jgi:hypothetical protein
LQKVRCKIKLEVDYVSYRLDTVDLLEKLAEIRLGQSAAFGKA